jgi:hypothetical protein
MTRINQFRNTAETSSVAWGTTFSTLVFAAVLIVCSVTVGCSSNNDQPKPVTSNKQIPMTQPQSPIAPAPVLAESKPAPKKIVHKKPATVNYTDKDNGVTFEYPRRYAIETGAAATELLANTPLPMNFVAPGGVALAAVELPETGFTNTDFSSAFFNVSVHKNLTADQCNEFSVPQPKSSESQSPETCHPEDRASCGTKDPMPAVASTASDASSQGNASAPAAASSTASSTPAAPEQQNAAKSPTGSDSKLLVGDLELRSTEAVSGEGTRQSDSKYFHVFQNGSCYEFALNVTTDASEEGVTKHVDRDKVFTRLEQILSTVKIPPVAVAPEVTAETKTAPAVPETPAQQ